MESGLPEQILHGFRKFKSNELSELVPVLKEDFDRNLQLSKIVKELSSVRLFALRVIS